MTKTAHLSLRIRPALTRRIDALAGALDRPKSWIVERAIEDYIETQSWQIKAIREGIAAADRSEFVPDDAIRSWIESLGSPKRRAKARR
jgi:predicted transcriptional regulator